MAGHQVKTTKMESQSKHASTSSSLFQVFLRLRPPPSPLVQLTQQSLYPALPTPERYLTVETADKGLQPTQITIVPPAESRKRAIERFAFTKVFEEHADQIDIFKGTGIVPLLDGVLGEGRDGLIATLGVSGSGKSHTILGSRSQRGLTQLSLDLLYRSIESQILQPVNSPSLIASISAVDASEALWQSAPSFLDSVFGDQVRRNTQHTPETVASPRAAKRRLPARPLVQPRFPDISDISVSADAHFDYAVVVSMYEVYNDRIFDLLSIPSNQKDIRRRALLFKPTEASPDRKVVAGLRKVVCSSYEEALMVLETGLMERRVAGTGSNSVSSRSHGFFCIEVKKRPRNGLANSWTGAQLTVVDLAGSERARQAKTAGATLAEAGKINESLMYLGQCLQMQSDNHDTTKSTLVPFRQCKLTELLFSNSFNVSQHTTHHRNPQRGIMIVTADPLGDFNATSQILRYSALAREVTVPRIPSVSSAILAGAQSRVPSGTLPTSGLHVDDAVVEMAFSEIARLNEEVEILRTRLADEEGRRQEAEENWQRAEDRADAIETEVREECWRTMDEQISQRTRQWQALRAEEADRCDEHMDHKIDIVSRGMEVYEDPIDDTLLRQENETLKSHIRNLEAQLPSADAMNVLTTNLHECDLNKSPNVPPKNASKKMRKLTTRKWDLMDENDLMLYE